MAPPSETRRSREAHARLVAAQEKCDSIAKMATHAEKHRMASLVKAYQAGVSQAEIARVVGLTSGRVWQLLRDAGALNGARGAEPVEPEPPKKVRPLRARRPAAPEPVGVVALAEPVE